MTISLRGPKREREPNDFELWEKIWALQKRLDTTWFILQIQIIVIILLFMVTLK